MISTRMEHKTAKSMTAAMLAFIFLLMFVTEISATNATAAYRSNTGSCATNLLNCPKIREWNSAGAGSWGSEVELATAGSPVREAVIMYSPISPKQVLVTQSDDGQLDAYVSFDGITWEVTNDIGRVWTTAPGTHSKRFDVDFETTTGNAIVVYAVENTSTTCDLAYKVLPANASNFSGIAEQCIDDTTRSSDVQYTWIKAARKPTAGSNEMIVIGFDGTDSIANAWVWSGSSWGNQRALLSATATGGYGAIGIAYAADGTKGMAVSGSGTTGNVATFYWSGGAWTDSADFDINASNNNDVRWIRLSADPATDDIQAVYVDSAATLGTAYWSGSVWTVVATIDAGLDISTTRPADFAWNPSGSTGKLVWDTDTTGTTLSQRTCSPQCTGATSTVSTYAGTGRWITMYTDPTAADSINILGARMNDANALGLFSWSGGAYANYGDTALSSGTSANTYEGSSLDFQRAFDTTAPTYSNQAQNESSIPAGGAVYLTVDWTDNVRLKTAVLETNETGTFQNKSGAYGSPDSLNGNFSTANFTWSNASTPAGTNISWRVWANDTYGNLNVTPYMSFVIRLYNFTASPTLDNFSVVNNTYIDRNFTLTNTGNQVLSIACSTNASWATSTSCPAPLAVGASQNATFRFNATGQPAGNPQVLITFTNANVTKTATANVTITLFQIYNFTASPALDNFSVVNNTYIDRNFTLTNTGNQPLTLTCTSNASWATSTSCPSPLAAGTSANATFRFNATGQPAGNPQVLITFTNANVTKTATANVTITAAPAYSFTVSPAIDNFTVNNNTYIDRDYTLNNTGNQVLSISCSSNVTWATNITSCPSSFTAGSVVNVTFRFNATGRSPANETVLLNFTSPNASSTATANVTITAAPTYDFTVSPSIDNFSLGNNDSTYRNYTLTNTGNQPLNISCSTNSSTFPVPYLNATTNISENTVGTASCSNGGTISSFVSWYGTNCPGGGISCGNCTIGATNCSVVFNNGACTDPCVGTLKYSDLNITCSGAPLVSSITGCPLVLSPGAPQNVTVLFNATGWPNGLQVILLNFTGQNVSRNATANVDVQFIPVNAALSADRTDYEACGTVFYSIQTTDDGGANVDSPLSINFTDPNGVAQLVFSAATTGGFLFSSYSLSQSASFGTWAINALAQNVLSFANFVVGTGSGSAVWKIDIAFSPDQISYIGPTTIAMNFTPYNQLGNRITGLLPSNITIMIDSTNVTGSVIESAGIYQYNYSTTAGSHVASATVDGVTSSRSFTVQ